MVFGQGKSRIGGSRISEIWEALEEANLPPLFTDGETEDKKGRDLPEGPA